MIRRIALMVAIMGAGTAAQAQAQAQTQVQAPVIVDVRTPSGELRARAMVYPSQAGIEVRVQAQGLPPGQYGAHLHAVGRCEGPDFASAGPHWNPTAKQHGTLNPQGHHLGDLPNLDVDADGGGRVEFAVPGGDVAGPDGLIDADGAAIVIHAAPDDYRTDPAGNSGARIACGAFLPSAVTP